MNIPTTSTTLLRDIARDSQNARWSEFVARYRPMMEAFLRERFPSIEADDIIQETLAALCKVLPDYQYAPDEKGRFHNYLTGILRNKAIRVLRKRMSDCEKLVEYADFGRAASMKPSCGRDALVASDGRAGCLQSAADDDQTYRVMCEAAELDASPISQSASLNFRRRVFTVGEI